MLGEKKNNPNQNQQTYEPIQNTTNQTIKINTGFQKGGINVISPTSLYQSATQM